MILSVTACFFQAEAADKMNQKMAELTSAIEAETEGATEKLQLYINCCSRDEGQVREHNNLGQQSGLSGPPKYNETSFGHFSFICLPLYLWSLGPLPYRCKSIQITECHWCFAADFC